MENLPLRIGHVAVVSVKLGVQAQIFHVDSAVLCGCSREIPDLSAVVIIIYILHFLALFFQLLFITLKLTQMNVTMPYVYTSCCACDVKSQKVLSITRATDVLTSFLPSLLSFLFFPSLLFLFYNFHPFILLP